MWSQKPMLKQIVSPFLQRYIRALDKSQLIKFLRFTMGLDIIAINKITVDFVKIDGMQRRPVTKSLFGWSFHFAWLKDLITWLINYFVWVVFFNRVLTSSWHSRRKFDERKTSYFGKTSSVIMWGKVNLCWDLFNENIDINFQSFVVFWTHKVKVLWNTLCLFARFLSFFQEPLIGVSWFILHVISLSRHLKLDGAELFGTKIFLCFWSKGPIGPKIMFFLKSSFLELLIEISDLRISDFRWIKLA